MKESRYNFFVKSHREEPTSSIIAFNGMTCALVKLDVEDYKKYLEGREHGFLNLDKDFLAQLKHGRFIIEDDCDEINILKHNLLKNRYATNRLALTIAPTLGCNFDCIYCYEADHSDFSKMSCQTQNQIIKVVENQIKINGIKILSISWYGGEPMLALEVIEALTNKLLDLCEKNNVQYKSIMITNGYLLTRSNIQKLKLLHINQIQITIDGPKEIHDSRRVLTNGSPTFDTIVENIQSNIDIIPKVALRINVDIKNVSTAIQVKRLFQHEKYQNIIFPYIAIVDALNDQYDEDKCLTMSDFFEQETVFNDTAVYAYPTPRFNACGADMPQSIVIAPDGSLYKCWNDIGIKPFSIGNINDSNKFEYRQRYYDYVLYDVTSDQECSKCAFLPICMGGCPNRRIVKSPLRCTKYKYNFEQYICKVADEISKIKEKNK